MDNTKFVISTIDKLFQLLELNPKLYGNLSAKERDNVDALKNFKQIAGDKAPVTIRIPKVLLNDTLESLQNANKNEFSVIHDMSNDDFCSLIVPQENVQEYQQLIPSGFSKTCSPQMVDLIKQEMKQLGVPCSVDKTDFIVTKEGKDALNQAFLKHEAITRNMDDAVARVVAKRMKERGLPCEIIGQEDDKVTLSYLKSNEAEINDIIEDLKNTRGYTESDFNTKFEGVPCIEFQLKDDVEVNRFMDLAVGKKFDYTITADNKVRVPEVQKHAALGCKTKMLEDLYVPVNINKYEFAKADAVIQSKVIEDVTKNKGLTRYFVSSENPEYYAVLEGDRALYIKKRIDMSLTKEGDYVDAVLAQTHDVKDGAKVSALLSYLGTPVEIPESQFDVKKLGVMNKHPYQKEITEEFNKHIDASALVKDDEMATLRKMFENRVTFYMYNKDEMVRDLDEAYTNKQISEQTKEKCITMFDNYHQRDVDINETLNTFTVQCSLDETIFEKSKVEQSVEKEFSFSKEVLYETNTKKAIETTETERFF